MNYLDEAVTKSLDEFMGYYKVVDTREIYSNGTEFVPIFRVKQWEEYNNKDKEIERLNKCYCERTDCSGRIKNSKKYESMQEEIERLNNIIKHTDSWIDRTIEIIKQQPSEDDTWILERLNGIKQCLKG